MTDAESKYVAWVAYLTGLMFLLFEAVDLLATLWPMAPGALSWRYGVVGLIGATLSTPLFGFMLVMVAATMLSQRRLLMVLAIVSALAALLLIPTMILFLLDVVQLRAQVRPEAALEFDKATVRALAKMVIALAVLVAFGFCSFKLGGRKPVSATASVPPLVRP